MANPCERQTKQVQIRARPVKLRLRPDGSMPRFRRKGVAASPPRAELRHSAPTGNAMESPCIKVCVMDNAREICTGCRRTLAEIAAWAQLSPAERRRIMAELPGRLLREGVQ